MASISPIGKGTSDAAIIDSAWKQGEKRVVSHVDLDAFYTQASAITGFPGDNRLMQHPDK